MRISATEARVSWLPPLAKWLLLAAGGKYRTLLVLAVMLIFEGTATPFSNNHESINTCPFEMGIFGQQE